MTRPVWPRHAALGFLAALAIGGAILVSGTLSGCDSPRQTSVRQEDDVSKETTLTPLQRGVIRRDANEVARAGIAAFLADDAAGMRTYFATEYPEYWAKVRADNQAANRRRVRKHQEESLDVTQINDDGTQALVEYYFIDQSYYTDLAGNPVTKPASGKDAEKMFQLTLDKKKKAWVIVRMIGAEEVMK